MDARALAETLASSVRARRTAQQLTLAELADRSGIAKSTLAQIEAAESNPTLSTLSNLAAALSCQLEDLLIAHEHDDTVTVIRAGGGVDISDDCIVGQLVRRVVLNEAVLEFYRLVLQPDRSEVSAGHGNGAREHVLVTSGRVHVGPVEGDGATLETGDYASYAADRPHRWKALDHLPAEVWVIATLVRQKI